VPSQRSYEARTTRATGRMLSAAARIRSPMTVCWRMIAHSTLALVAGVLGTLITYEAIRFAAARDRVRHPER
jgi:hypothetical protein